MKMSPPFAHPQEGRVMEMMGKTYLWRQVAGKWTLVRETPEEARERRVGGWVLVLREKLATTGRAVLDQVLPLRTDGDPLDLAGSLAEAARELLRTGEAALAEPGVIVTGRSG